MVHKKQKRIKLAAIIALFAILVSIVGTGILVIVSSLNNANAPALDLEEFMKTYSGQIDIQTGSELPDSGSDLDTSDTLEENTN